MEIHLLGAVELSSHGTVVRLGSDRARCLLASLAFDVGRPVAQDALVHRLWDDEPPDTAMANLHTYISRLRRALKEADGTDRLPPPAVITLSAHTYTLETDPASIDWHRFLRLTREAGSAASAGDQARALTELDAAESLWIGEALAGLPGSWARSTRGSMAARRLAAAHSRLALHIRLAHFAEAIAEATQLVQDHPLDEALTRHLMVALYGAGNHAEALTVYQRARRLFRDRLGSDPGEPLARTHAQILRGAPLQALVPDLRPTPAPRHAPAAGPHNLPRRPHLLGRETELRRVLPAEGAGGPTGPAGGVKAISGTAGVGKTALALYAAHELADRYPQGQVFLHLRGNVAAQPPMRADAALAALLGSFGVAPDAIPRDHQERVALWRTVIRGKRAVIILDDARNAEQVAPLLPDDSASLVLITSRHRLAELPSAHPVFLDVLPLEDAVGLFRALVGTERAADRDKIAEVVGRVEHLPLAVEIVASRFKGRPSWDLGHLLERLNRPRRLKEIHDHHQEIATALEMSYASLSDDQRAAFRRLSFHPVPDFGLHAAAALIGEAPDRTERLIEDLLDCHLLQEPRPDRYRLYDLLGEFASFLAVLEEPADERTAVTERLTGYALRAADRADRVLHPHRTRLALPAAGSAPAAPGSVPAWPDTVAAGAWISDELESLLAVEHRARAAGRAQDAAWLAHVLAEFADSEIYWPEAVAMHQAAAAHWQAAGDPRAECRALLDLTTVLSRASRYPESARVAERALELARAQDDATATADALSQLGILHWHVGEYGEAVTILGESLELRADDIWGRSRGLNNLAVTYLYMGDPKSALTTFTEALNEVRRIGDPPSEAVLLNNIGDLRLRAGQKEAARADFSEALALSPEQGSELLRSVIRVNLAGTLTIPDELNTAVELYNSGLAFFRRIGDRGNEAGTLNGLGAAYRAAARHAEARVHHESALALAQAIGSGHDEAAARRGIGDADRSLGHLPQARLALEAAAALAHRISAPEEEAPACESLAEILVSEGRVTEARELWKRAAELFSNLNQSAYERIRQRLNQLDHPPSDW